MNNLFADSGIIMYPSYVRGSSIVIGIKYRDGVVLAADMGLKPVGKHSVIGGTGGMTDFQEIMRHLDLLMLQDDMRDDGNSLGPKEVHKYLTRIMCNHKFNSSSLVVGGVKKGLKYLGTVGMNGERYEDNHVVIGTGNDELGLAILRDEWRENLSYEEGVKLVEKCMRVILASSLNKLQIAKITDKGSTLSLPYSLNIF